MKKDSVFEDLRRRIIQDEFSPDQWLVERDLSEEYTLSRTPIREVLRRLANIGLIELQPNKGYRVKRLSLEDIRDLFHAREAIEGMATRLACLKGDSKFFDSVKELSRRLESMDVESNAEAGVAIGKSLHDLIMDTADNDFIQEFYCKLTNLAAMTRNITKKSPGIEIRSKRAHLEIMKALTEKDADSAETLMREHLRSTCSAMISDFLYVATTR